jgi:ornithine decarboxylase
MRSDLGQTLVRPWSDPIWQSYFWRIYDTGGYIDTFIYKSRESEFAMKHETPYLLMDLRSVSKSFDSLARHFPSAGIYYAVKANPAKEIIQLLHYKGSSFDVASPAEIDLCLQCGVRPETLSYGNTIKKAKDIAYAFSKGVELFSFDSSEELDKLATFAPGSKVFCRVLVSSEGASWPLSRKFGCSLELAEELLYCASKKAFPFM